MDRDVVLDLFIFDKNNKFLSNLNIGEGVIQNFLTVPILILNHKEHPVDAINEYGIKNNLRVMSVKLLPGIYLNRFDTEKDKDYLVLSFKILVENLDNITQNKNFVVGSFEDFSNSTNLLPEFKKKNFIKILNNENVFYKGYYKESDNSNEIISLDLIS